MDIRFCDICNESIAKIHFEEGRAIQRSDGVSVTASSGDGRAAAPAGRRTDLGLWAAALAILVAAGLAWLAVARIERGEQVLRRESTERAAVLRTELDALAAQMGRGAAEEAERRDELLTELLALREADQAGRVRIEELAVSTQRLLGDLEERLAGLDSSLEGRREGPDLGELTRAVDGLRADVEVLAGAVASGLEAAAQRPAARPEAEDEPWAARLGDPDPIVRWNAVDQVLREGDPESADALLPLAGDPDLLVRMSVARALGELGNPVAIPALIEALEDREPPVREAAVDALRTLSGRNFRFDPLADEDDRARRVEDWREWWERGGASELDD